MTGSRWALIPATAACAVAGLGFHRLFAWSDLIPVVAVAAVLPAVAAAGFAVIRKTPALWLSAVVTVVLWMLTVAATLFRDRGLTHVPHAVVLGLHDGWKTMLTTVPPLPGRAETLVTVSAATWLASYAVAEATLRTRKVAVTLLPAVALLGLALVLDAGAPGSNVLAGVLFAVLCGLTILLRSGRQSYGAGVGAVAVFAGVAAVVPPVSGAQPFSLRAKVTPPPARLQTAVSPLDEIPAWLQNPDAEMFTVRSAQGQNWRLAVFDTFDGVTWTSSDRFVPTGGRVPADPAAGNVAGQRRSQQVTIAGLTGPWLPAADRPTHITGASALVDPASGELLDTDPLRRGLRYDVDSATSQPAASELLSASAAADPSAAADLALPTTDATGQELDAYEDLKQIAQQATVGADSPFQQAAMLERYLQKNESVDLTAIPGHTYRELQFFLDTTHRGTSEQFATAFAVMARTLALPTRVVVGFRPGVEEDGVWHVHSGDALAWPEVRFSGIGWVPFYPTPDQPTASAPSENKPAAGADDSRKNLDQQTADQAAQSFPAGDPAPAATAASHPTAPAHHSVVPLIAASCAGLVLAYLVMVLATPPFRRARRRSRPGAEQRVLGAWHQVLRCLRPLVVAEPAFASLTAHEIAALGTGALGAETGPGFCALASIVDHTRFAGQGATAELADEAWRLCRGLEHAAAGAVPLWRRSLGRLHPRVLWRG